LSVAQAVNLETSRNNAEEESGARDYQNKEKT
jgi:hypothetical protein